MTRRYVLDANALLSFLNEEPGAARVEQLITGAIRDHTLLLLSVISWGEIFYVSWNRRGEDAARLIISSLARFPLEIVPADLQQITKAAEIKAIHKIPYADSIAAAVAELHHATLVTSDNDFHKLGRRVPLLWLPRS
jgi:predicted nucleic acid-binding protein